MKTGPNRTDLTKFSGFGFKPSGGAAPSKRTAAGGKGGVSNLFQEALDEENPKKGLSSLPSWGKLTVEARQAQRQAEALQAEDPTVFQYDEVIDDVKDDEREEHGCSQVVRTTALEQKKRVGLTVLSGADAVKSGNVRKSKYIEKVIVATDRRKVEQQIIEDRALKKEKEKHKDEEVFVTEAFKQELKRRKKFEEELEQQEMRDSARAAEKREDGQGFADMYRNLLNGGLASSRGGEKVREQAVPRAELDAEVKAEVKTEVKEEVKEETKEEEAKLEVKEEPAEAAPAQAAPAQPAPEEARQEKALSARERYLARKRQAEGS